MGKKKVMDMHFAVITSEAPACWLPYNARQGGGAGGFEGVGGYKGEESTWGDGDKNMAR